MTTRAIVFQDFEIIAEGESIGEIVDEIYIKVNDQLYNAANVVEDTLHTRAKLSFLRNRYDRLKQELDDLTIITAGSFRRDFAIKPEEK